MKVKVGVVNISIYQQHKDKREREGVHCPTVITHVYVC